MVEFDIPGTGKINIKYLVFDYNGTLAVDGILMDGVRETLDDLAKIVEIHVLTADTFGKSAAQLEGISCKLSILAKEKQDEGKLNYVGKLGAANTAAIGNGRNDRLMLKAAALGIGVILREGIAVDTLNSADLIFNGIIPALEIFSRPLRLTATLRI